MAVNTNNISFITYIFLIELFLLSCFIYYILGRKRTNYDIHIIIKMD